MVFGRKLYKAECYFLNQINSGAKILIVGGGNGELLKHLPVDCHVEYVEFSRKMIAHARKIPCSCEVNFIWSDYLKYEPEIKYDWVIANFFLDVFNEVNLGKACHKLYGELGVTGRLIVTDFQDTAQWRGKLMLKLMHWFFRIVSGLESSQIKPISQFLQKAGFNIQRRQNFSRGKIFSIIFKKDGNL